MLQKSRSVNDILVELDSRRERDPDVHGARLFGLVFPTGREDLEELIKGVYERFLFVNALNPLKFSELGKIEREVISMVGDMVHRVPTDKHGGSMTSGGTESILMSMLVSRERARARGVKRPKILAPESAHAAYAKAAHYFDMDYGVIPLDNNYRADATAARSLVDEQTCVVIGSAYSYPHGAIDPIPALGEIAGERGIDCHVDACVGGFVLPFMELNGIEVPPWDFRVPGVTQMSIDIHKYGYVPKGASVVLHRDDDWLWHQTFFYENWGSGLYATPAIAGSRAAAPTVAAWAVMQHLGLEGYQSIVSDLCETVARIRSGIEHIDGLEIVGEPIGPLLALKSDTVDLYAVGDVMDDRGWHLNRNTSPKGLHMMLAPAHNDMVEQLISDLTDAVANPGTSRGKQARYN